MKWFFEGLFWVVLLLCNVGLGRVVIVVFYWVVVYLLEWRLSDLFGWCKVIFCNVVIFVCDLFFRLVWWDSLEDWLDWIFFYWKKYCLLWLWNFVVWLLLVVWWCCFWFLNWFLVGVCVCFLVYCGKYWGGICVWFWWCFGYWNWFGFSVLFGYRVILFGWFRGSLLFCGVGIWNWWSVWVFCCVLIVGGWRLCGGWGWCCCWDIWVVLGLWCWCFSWWDWWNVCLFGVLCGLMFWFLCGVFWVVICGRWVFFLFCVVRFVWLLGWFG